MYLGMIYGQICPKYDLKKTQNIPKDFEPVQAPHGCDFQNSYLMHFLKEYKELIVDCQNIIFCWIPSH